MAAGVADAIADVLAEDTGVAVTPAIDAPKTKPFTVRQYKRGGHSSTAILTILANGLKLSDQDDPADEEILLFDRMSAFVRSLVDRASRTSSAGGFGPASGL